MPKIFSKVSALVIAAMIALVGISSAANAEVARQASFFNSQEIEYAGQGNLNKWQDALARHSEAGLNGAAAAEWNGIIAKYADLDLADKIVAVNREINRFYYAEDAAQYGNADYWASPMEFFSKGAGDCEDFAIAKYMLLKAMGVSEDDMRIVILEIDSGLNKGMGHAVLIVDSEDGQMVLDNQMFQPELASAINDYNPIYSVNANNWWMHVAN